MPKSTDEKEKKTKPKSFLQKGIGSAANLLAKGSSTDAKAGSAMKAKKAKNKKAKADAEAEAAPVQRGNSAMLTSTPSFLLKQEAAKRPKTPKERMLKYAEVHCRAGANHA